MQRYQPCPVKTDNVVLSLEMHLLAEILAEDGHERWAQLQIQNGWNWGARRDPFLRRDPDIVRYDALPALTKEYILQASEKTLKTMLALGYRIVPPPKVA